MLLIAYGINLRGFDRASQIASALGTAFVLLVLWNKQITHVTIEDHRWLLNSGQSGKHRIDIASIVYIARAPQYIFRSWGARMTIFFREDAHRVKATWLNEGQYTQDTLRAIIKACVSIKPNIELDEQYKRLLANENYDLKSESPSRSTNQVDQYVASKYGTH
jgi:hypothetical protein